MGRNILFGSIFLQILIFVSAKSFYTLVAPETLKAGTDYSVAVTLHYNTEPAVVKVGIYGPSFNSTKTLEISTYNIAVARFDVPNLVNGIYKLKVQGVKGMIFGNVTELKCDFAVNVMEDMKQLVELKAQAGKNTTASRLGPLNLRYKKTNRRIAQDIAIDVSSNETIPYMVYALVVKGKVHSHQYLEVDGNETTEYITLSPSLDMLPHAFLYVYYIRNDTLIWNQLSIFFGKRPESDMSQNETTPKLPEGTEHILTDDFSGMTRPGEISGLITLTNALVPKDNDQQWISSVLNKFLQKNVKKLNLTAKLNGKILKHRKRQ